jgi:hypothetical protein
VAGQITPGAHVTPIPPDAGTGFSFDGGRDGLTLVGLLMVLVSLTVLVPSGLAAARETHRHSAERAMKRYLDAMENSGREEMTRR